ncbi:O-acetylserine/cysteine efflux transporter [Streptomyces sp. AmelKG-E11A]|nr:O-acetylserine/cysteine efflux transporter [Streptomyces sp. AmelKG-E11A]
MRPAHISLAVLCAAIWGVNFVVIDIGLSHFPPLLFAALRFLVAAVPAIFLVGRPSVAWKWIIAVGLVLGVGKFGLVFLGMDQGMPAGLASLVLQVQAVFTAIFAAVVLRERPGPLRTVGMGIALLGVIVAAIDEGTSGPLFGFALVVAAAAGWGVSNVLTRKAAPPDAFNFIVWVSAVPVLPLLLLSLLFEGPSTGLAALRSLDWTAVGAIVFVAWISTNLGFGAWGWLLRHHPASTVAPFTLLVPVFGMTSAALFLDESISTLRWCAAALLVVGVAATSFAPSRTPTTPTPVAAGSPPPSSLPPGSPLPDSVPRSSLRTGPLPHEPIPADPPSPGVAVATVRTVALAPSPAAAPAAASDEGVTQPRPATPPTTPPDTSAPRPTAPAAEPLPRTTSSRTPSTASRPSPPD